MAFTAYVSETLRVKAKDLTHSDSGAVTTGATVTVDVYDAANVMISTASTTVVGSGDDWWIDITAPATVGTYSVRVTAVKSGATWKAAETLSVLPFDSDLSTSYAATGDLAERMVMDPAEASEKAALVNVLAAASRQIDGYCNRIFYQLTSTTRHFTAECGYVLEVDDLVSVGGIATDSDGDRVYEDTWATTDYDLEPYNAADRGFPYRQLRTTPNGLYAFPTVRKGIKITGTWGWPSVPDAVREATCLLGMRLYKRPSAPFAIDFMSGDLGSSARIPSVDPDVKALLAPYRQFFIGAV